MASKAKLRPGELWIVAGMLALLGGAIWLPVVLFGHMPVYSALKSEGRTVDGVIRLKQIETTTSSRRRRNSSSENFYFVIAFDPGKGVPFTQSDALAPEQAPPTVAKSGKEIVAGMFGPAKGSGAPVVGAGAATIRLHAGTYENFQAKSIGDAISVTFLPDDPKTAKLTEGLRAFNPWPPILAALALLAGGIAAIWSGFRRRSAAMSRQAMHGA